MTTTKKDVIVRLRRVRARRMLLEPFRKSERIKEIDWDPTTGIVWVILNDVEHTKIVFHWKIPGNEIVRIMKTITGETINLKLTGFPDIKNPVQLKMF